MSAFYNPIVRNFNAYRAVFCDALGVPRHAVRPGTLLAELVPPPERRRVWAELQARGLSVPDLELSDFDRNLWAAAVTLKVGAVAAWLGSWWPEVLWLVPSWYAAHRASRPAAVQLPPFLATVGELAMYGTRHADHTTSGYTWSRGDILLKVRLIVAESLHLRLSAVRPESRWLDLAS